MTIWQRLWVFLARPRSVSILLLPRDCVLVAHINSLYYRPEAATQLRRMLEKRIGTGRVIVVRGPEPVTFTAMKPEHADAASG